MPLLSAGVKLFDHLKDDGHRADNQGCLHNVADVVKSRRRADLWRVEPARLCRLHGLLRLLERNTQSNVFLRRWRVRLWPQLISALFPASDFLPGVTHSAQFHVAPARK